MFAGIGSVLGRRVKMDAHTAAGVNREAARLLVLMEANGEFLEEVPIFMTNDDDMEMEESIKVVYWNPPPRCVKCCAFGHWTRWCHAELQEKTVGNEQIQGEEEGLYKN